MVNPPSFSSVSQAYRGLDVFVTGHTGFKGAWLSLWLKKLGARVHGYGLKSPTQLNLHEILHGADSVWSSQTEGDIRDGAKIQDCLGRTKPSLIFHMAAQPLVRLSYREPVETFEINTLGTIRVLEAVRSLRLPSSMIVITSDKCYENRNWDYGYRENDPLGGHDVYSMSKAATELVVQSWRDSFFAVDEALGAVATVRAGNVIGGGDYAADRLVPDCIRSLMEKKAIHIRNPGATRPWQHVLDCLSGYLNLGGRLIGVKGRSPLASAFNFGPPTRSNRSVSDVVKALLMHWPGSWVDDSQPGQVHEAHRLHLNTDKSAQHLGWFPTWDFEETVRRTTLWYRARHLESGEMRTYCDREIDQFTAAMGEMKTGGGK